MVSGGPTGEARRLTVIRSPREAGVTMTEVRADRAKPRGRARIRSGFGRQIFERARGDLGMRLRAARGLQSASFYAEKLVVTGMWVQSVTALGHLRTQAHAGR